METGKDLLALYDEYASRNEQSLLAGNEWAPEEKKPIKIFFSRPTLLDISLGQFFTSEGYADFWSQEGRPNAHLKFRPKRGMGIGDQEEILFGVLDSLEKNGYSVEPEESFGDLSDRHAAFERAVKGAGGGIWLYVHKNGVRIADVVFLNEFTYAPELIVESVDFSLYTNYPHSLAKVSRGINGDGGYNKVAANLIKTALRHHTADAKKIANIVAEGIASHYRFKLPKYSKEPSKEPHMPELAPEPASEPAPEPATKRYVELTAEEMATNLDTLKKEIPKCYFK